MFNIQTVNKIETAFSMMNVRQLLHTIEPLSYDIADSYIPENEYEGYIINNSWWLFKTDNNEWDVEIFENNNNALFDGGELKDMIITIIVETIRTYASDVLKAIEA